MPGDCRGQKDVVDLPRTGVMDDCKLLYGYRKPKSGQFFVRTSVYNPWIISPAQTGPF